MNKCIAILATMDTKGEECAYLKSEIESQGGTALLIDFGVVGETQIEVDIDKETVAERGGTALSTLRELPSRDVASQVMVAGATLIVSEEISSGRVHGIISLGGTQGTSNACRVMQTLPYGVPKVMVSTLASGDTSPYVGIKDITMMFSVADILGLNPFMRHILSNAAGAVCGMAKIASRMEFDRAKPLIGISNLGVLTQGCMQAIQQFTEKGYETIVFHAVGAGGRAMEQMMREGIITAVFDYGLGDIADSVFGGIRAADQNRLSVAAELGLPQVVVPGGIDHLGILLDEPNTVPEKYRDSIYSYHNPSIFVPRTSGEEMTEIMSVIAERLQHCGSNTVFMLPTLGVSSYSAKEGALYDPDSDAIFHKSVERLLPEHIECVRMNNNAEDKNFVTRAVEILTNMIDLETKTA